MTEWTRGEGEALRVTLDDVNGRHVLVARLWRLEGDRWAPSAASITLAALDFGRLAHALAQAEAQARELGLDMGGAI